MPIRQIRQSYNYKCKAPVARQYKVTLTEILRVKMFHASEFKSNDLCKDGTFRSISQNLCTLSTRTKINVQLFDFKSQQTWIIQQCVSAILLSFLISFSVMSPGLVALSIWETLQLLALLALDNPYFGHPAKIVDFYNSYKPGNRRQDFAESVNYRLIVLNKIF